MKKNLPLKTFAITQIATGIALLALSTAKLFVVMENIYLDYADEKIHTKCVIRDINQSSKNELFLRSSDAGCLIEQDGNILFIKGAFSFENPKRKGMLLFPGGTKREGEYGACTASRETKEEANIDVVIMDVVGTLGNGFTLFLCKPKNRISQNDLKYYKPRETSGMEFIPIKEIVDASSKTMKKFLYPSDIEFLSSYYKAKAEMNNKK